ncbi:MULTISPECIES: CBS domain-containing protein [Sinorhizobium]|uniref:Inosine-5-monophosphate dehydrogenase n=2 Tax=Sinorhizobium TaxID=28105 RepID=A0A2S3YRR1_9HYPH|nr:MULTISPECIES: CBS domain-containing protein [Sinorhizobium]ASY60171.1 Small Molecule Metabolism [Sinorhizobium sp. CCBAU 05631]AUX80367.1 CBS domain-containing protein [Sinorhizobium fredii]PDT43271.1 CBS domain-containing protein [Sinorhizobium sp. FG01]PDT52818.1 CBS domain-containing protein [Sinorhizobium sp. NG07B]POH28991.1 inosine-5-monophosphate dehydrogenase [Sinorhizobium americanum]
MHVSDIMSRDVHLATPNDTIRDVARQMADNDIGFMPVEDHDRLVGMVTDRDIVVRGVADGLDPQAKVRDVMTTDVKYCFEDEEVDDVARNMGDIQVRRLPVVNRDKRLVGIVSLADAAREQPAAAGAGLKGVTMPGGEHNQAGRH